MEPVTAFFAIILGGVLVGICVHFIPASATGAMSAATGIATGPSMLSAGAGMAGLLSASYSIDSGLSVVLASGATASALMVALTILSGNIANAFGTGVPPASGQTASGQSITGKSTKDAISGWDQKPYISPGTDGHGMPVQTNFSGLIGAFIGGTGGALVLFAVYTLLVPILRQDAAFTISGFIAGGVFLINCVLPAYTLVGKTEGMFDQKIRKTPKTLVSCFIVSSVIAMIIYIAAVVIQ
ncbi:tetrahydromethanopterin S-methyltransferase, subunit D [Candidatus Methanoperedens nitroreducens]|uniref:Tetrahydromethanopterin S-methyltransferase subunit D n=1 Tax=Candidatus Methanoperedens nitratireducens TaxID=1392998 RepID=A0A062V557_9EURY|nr:tetrahydromethanopterin S-methyltransferase subunit D [Candidatus Methanoperedens nitroreducens]KCZ72427.1 tetrahydromethanopterin S-methyltransferase, subunit D [Candidatus Methanoperedens nitroreducens]MDJ1423638.1 tetrahydromethanopterin S-methyltransferase subunit D [Candidatus Methanoperedens sp.]